MFSSPLKRLRQKSLLDAIPDTIDVPDIGSQTTRTVPIEHATIDEVEFALVALNCQRTNLYRVIGAMGDVLKMARRQGARGTDIAIGAAVRDLEGGK
jgi:hypothetical protein